MANGRITAGTTQFVTLLRKLELGRFQTWEIWQDFIVITACAISNATDKSEPHYSRREEMYMDRIMKYNEGERFIIQQMFHEMVDAMHENPTQDFLGEMYMQLDLGSDKAGQFFTPYHLCEAMAEMSSPEALDKIEEQGWISVCDSSCGAGATLLGFANSLCKRYLTSEKKSNWQYHVLFVAQDIDSVVGLMCYIQMSLRGCAGYVKIADSLANPITYGENDDSYWYTTMYFHEIWHLRRKYNTLDQILNHAKGQDRVEPEDETEEEEPTKEESQKAEEPTYIVTEQGQLALF